MTNIEKFKKIMNEEDKDYIGIELKNIESLNNKQKEAIIDSLDKFNLFAALLDENEKRYVVDSKSSNLYIVPALYKDYMKEYDLSNAYFSDLLPILFELNFFKENKLGVIYFINEPFNQPRIFINENAENMFKYMNPDEIIYLIKKESINKSRVRSKK